MDLTLADHAFPRLSTEDMDLARSLGSRCDCADGDVLCKPGDRDVDFLVVERGQVEILNPTDGNEQIAVHTAGHFTGDIDLLTRRRIIVTAVARGNDTAVLRIPGEKLRDLLNTV